MFEGYPDIMSVEEACDALRIGFNALYDLLKSGELKSFKNGRIWRIPKAAVIEYITGQSGLGETPKADPIKSNKKTSNRRSEKPAHPEKYVNKPKANKYVDPLIVIRK